MELIEGTVQAWTEAITHGRAFDPMLDRDRFRTAFQTLVCTRRAWPQVSDFLEALPPRVPQKYLPTKVEDTEASRRIMREISEKFGIGR